jgi:hypothetical protein
MVLVLYNDSRVINIFFEDFDYEEKLTAASCNNVYGIDRGESEQQHRLQRHR